MEPLDGVLESFVGQLISLHYWVILNATPNDYIFSRTSISNTDYLDARFRQWGEKQRDFWTWWTCGTRPWTALSVSTYTFFPLFPCWFWFNYYLSHCRQYQQILSNVSNAIATEENPLALDNICAAITRLIVVNISLVPVDQVRNIFHTLSLQSNQ